MAAAGVDPLAHFNTFGWHEGRDPNGWFDTSAYLSKYADVAAAGVNPLEHYLTFGWKEGRDASGRFHTADYLAANPDGAAAGVNPLEHFLQFGFYENRAGVGPARPGAGGGSACDRERPAERGPAATRRRPFGARAMTDDVTARIAASSIRHARARASTS